MKFYMLNLIADKQVPLQIGNVQLQQATSVILISYTDTSGSVSLRASVPVYYWPEWVPCSCSYTTRPHGDSGHEDGGQYTGCKLKVRSEHPTQLTSRFKKCLTNPTADNLSANSFSSCNTKLYFPIYKSTLLRHPILM
jgi:hypothetical protein